MLRAMGIFVLCIGGIAVRAGAHGADGGGSGGGMGEPAPAGSAVGGLFGKGGFFGPRANETADHVREELSQLERERTAASERHAEAEIAALDQKLERVKLRLQIAEKRQERDDLRARREMEAAARIDQEIHELKKKISPGGRTGP